MFNIGMKASVCFVIVFAICAGILRKAGEIEAHYYWEKEQYSKVIDADYDDWRPASPLESEFIASDVATVRDRARHGYLVCITWRDILIAEDSDFSVPVKKPVAMIDPFSIKMQTRGVVWLASVVFALVPSCVVYLWSRKPVRKYPVASVA